eukprot:866324-Rhodomonas_salina.1
MRVCTRCLRVRACACGCACACALTCTQVVYKRLNFTDVPIRFPPFTDIAAKIFATVGPNAPGQTPSTSSSSCPAPSIFSQVADGYAAATVTVSRVPTTAVIASSDHQVCVSRCGAVRVSVGVAPSVGVSVTGAGACTGTRGTVGRRGAAAPGAHGARHPRSPRRRPLLRRRPPQPHPRPQRKVNVTGTQGPEPSLWTGGLGLLG